MSQLKRYNGTDWEVVGGVKQEDTLPINAVVEYTGDTVPEGYELVEEYSLNEVKTNSTWINGKPIYRKVLTANSISTGGSTAIPTGISNLDEYIKLYGMAYSNNNSFLIPKTHHTTFAYQMGIWTDDVGNNVYIEAGSSITGINKVYVIVEYTKTTD